MEAVQKPTDKRRIRGEESRKLILQAAISSIAALGLGSMTLDRVAERAGISRGLVVFHFKSKNNLIVEVLNYLGNQYASGWDTVVKSNSGSSMLKILRLVDYDIRFACENPQYISVTTYALPVKILSIFPPGMLSGVNQKAICFTTNWWYPGTNVMKKK